MATKLVSACEVSKKNFVRRHQNEYFQRPHNAYSEKCWLFYIINLYSPKKIKLKLNGIYSYHSQIKVLDLGCQYFSIHFLILSVIIFVLILLLYFLHSLFISFISRSPVFYHSFLGFYLYFIHSLFITFILLRACKCILHSAPFTCLSSVYFQTSMRIPETDAK